MGDNRNNRGATKENLYRRYMDMKSRCYSRTCCNYKYYGARGIKICDDWLGKDGYSNFKAWSLANGYSKDLSIDRIDNDGDYCPENCRWTTHSIQNMSMRHKNTSGYVGISKSTIADIWYGRVKMNNKTLYTGCSKDIKEVARMRNEFIIKNGLPNVLNEV